MDWRAEEPDNLFPAPRDAAFYLGGLAGFWGGVGVFLILAAVGATPVVVVGVAILMLGSLYVTMRAVHKLERRITGRVVRPWPFGYASLRIQVIATLPSTVMAAAQRLNFNAVVVALAMYALLVIDFVALIALAAKR